MSAHAAVSKDDDESQAAGEVDFNALHAALGDLPPPANGTAPNVGESHGRLSATYASARPHAIPATRAPADDPNAPAVIVTPDPVKVDETIPIGAPQQRTVPMAGAPAFAGRVPAPGATPTPGGSFTPQAFVAEAPSKNVHATELMPGRPPRPRTPTVVVRLRGPTKQQKLLVFMLMLLVFVGGGVAFLVYGKALGLSIDGAPRATTPPPRNPSAAPTNTTAVPITATTQAAIPSSAPVVTPSSLPSASSKKPQRR